MSFQWIKATLSEIIAVIIGVLLAFVLSYFQQKSERQYAVQAIQNELAGNIENMNSTTNLIRWLYRYSRDRADDSVAIVQPGVHIPLSTNIYVGNIGVACKGFDKNELANLHVIYSHFNNINSIVHQIETNFMLRPLQQLSDSEKTALDDLLNRAGLSLETAIKLTELFLAEQPEMILF